MKRLTIFSILLILLPTSVFALTGLRGASCLTGGTAGCLDRYNGATLNDGDVAIVVTDGVTYIFRLEDASAATENSPLVIQPDSDGGDKRWILQDVANGPDNI